MTTLMRCRTVAQIVALTALITAGGCEDTDWTRNIVWAPDGRYAAVIGPEREGEESRLFLADAAGHLTSLHEPDAYGLAWFADSEHVVVARTRRIATFAELARVLGPERTRILEQEGEEVLQMMRWPEFPSDVDRNLASDLFGISLYLNDRHGDDIPEPYRADVPDDATVPLHTLSVGRVVNGRLVTTRTLYQDFTEVQSIRPAPDGRFVAFVTKGDDFLEKSVRRLYVAVTDGSAPPDLVDWSTNDYPDWSLDGHSLLYLRVAASEPNLGSFGCLVTVDVSQPKRNTCLVHAVFGQDARVRTLDDGRVLFDAFDITFPLASTPRSVTENGGTTTPQASARTVIFSVRPSDVTIVPRPLLPPAYQGAAVAFYDVSPDRTRMIVGTAEGDVGLLRFSDDGFELLPFSAHRNAGDTQSAVPLATWSGPAAITYLTEVGPRHEYALWQGTSRTVLSRDWPPDLLASP